MRRVVFFLVAAVVGVLLVPAAPADLRYVPVTVAATYALLALAAGAEALGERRER